MFVGTFKEIIENWIIKKTFLRKRKRQDEENEIREKEIKVDSSGRKVKKLRKTRKEKYFKENSSKTLG